MRVKSKEIMERILSFAKDFVRDNGRSPSTTEIAEEIGVARGTAYTYLTAMRDRGMIKYDGRDIRTEDGELVDIIAGPFLIVGLTEDSFESLNDEMLEKYSEMFSLPETFIRVDGKIKAIPCEATAPSMSM